MVSPVEVTRPATDPYLTDKSESYGSGRVGSGGVQIIMSQVELVERFPNLTARVSSRVRRLPQSRESRRVSSGQLTRSDST